MSKTTYHTVRLEPTMKDYTEEVYEKHEHYNSTKNLGEKAVANNSEHIENQVKGAADLRRLIQALCRADGVNTKIPERTFSTKLRDENLSSATKLDLTPQQLNSIEKVTRSTGLGKGGVIRVCLIRELHKISSQDWLLHEPRKSDIQSSWDTVESNIEELFSSLQSKLETKFVRQLWTTRQKVQQDPKARDELIAHYENYFQESVGYERLQGTGRGKKILEGLESLSHGRV